MTTFKTVRGIRRQLFSLKMALFVFAFYAGQLLSRKRSLKSFLGIIARLNKFKGKQGHTKFIKMNGGTRIGLYIPTFPFKSFYRASENMLGEKDNARCVTAVVSITSSCYYDCDYCYQKLNEGKDLPLSCLLDTVKEMQNDGVAIFVIEGGEPFSKYDRLREVCETIDNRSEIWINTTGAGVTVERLTELRKLGVTALKISIHHHQSQKHNAFLKSDTAYDQMKKCVTLCRDLNIPYAFNSYMAKECYLNGHFEKMMELAKEWEASYIQCLTPRSAGGNLHEKPFSYSKDELDELVVKIRMYNRDLNYDAYPVVFFDDFEERCIFGCTAGGAGRVYLNSQGELQPCHAVNCTFGNVQHNSYKQLSESMRSFFKKPHTKTACTVLAPPIAKYANQGAEVPIPFIMIKKEITEFSNE